MLAVEMMLPPPCSRMMGAACFMPRIGPVSRQATVFA